MLRTLYTALLYLVAPFALATIVARSMRDPAYRDRWRERYGFTRLRCDVPPLWVHAVSVGEVQAAIPLVRELMRRYADVPIVVTTATPTGATRVRAAFGTQVAHAYLPYDLPGATARFLRRVKPRAAIVMETEIWPNLFRACARRDVPILLASARLSEKSERRYGRFRELTRAALEHVIVAAQTTTDADRYRSIGARDVHVTGNVKFDIAIDAQVRVAGERLRGLIGTDRPVWVAGSTHEGEEALVLDAHRQLRTTHPAALLVLVPRHPQRFVEVAELLRARGETFVARSTQAAIEPRHSVLLLDTLGELLTLYAAADVAFVAGSLVPIGGHNLLEPAALGKPIVVGPYNFNAPDIAQLFLSSGAARQVSSPFELATTVGQFLSSPQQREATGAEAQRLLQTNRGAVANVVRLLDAMLAARSAPS